MNTSRKIWTEKEDSIITDIILNRNITKWSIVAKIMEEEYNIPGRTGKQCRQRWHNQLDPNIKSEKWTDQEEELLYQYHNQFGNKWAKISQYIPGRTDNCVKNHFYSNLRKALRRINLMIAQKKIPGDYRQIRPSILPKVIAVAEEQFGTQPRDNGLPEALITKCVDVKNQLSKYCKIVDLEPEEVPQLVELINVVIELAQIFKHNKAAKLVRSNHSAGQNLFKSPAIKEKTSIEDIDPVKNDGALTDSMTSPADHQGSLTIEDESESMDQPIALDLRMELDSPTLPLLRRRSDCHGGIPPYIENLDAPEFQVVNPRDAIIRLLNPCPVMDDPCCL